MGLSGLAEWVLSEPVLAGAVDQAREGRHPALDLTGPAALRPFVVQGLVDAGRTVLAVAATSREAEDLVEALGSLVDPHSVAVDPSWETLPHERLSPRSDTVGRRLAVLDEASQVVVLRSEHRADLGAQHAVHARVGALVDRPLVGIVEHVDWADRHARGAADALARIDDLVHQEVDRAEAPAIDLGAPCVSPFV